MSTVGGRYFLDLNGSETQDSSDGGVAGAKVFLYNGSTLVGTTTTDEAGNYRFNNVDQGYHYVKFEKIFDDDRFVKTGVGEHEKDDSDVWKVDAAGDGISGTFYVARSAYVSDVDAGITRTSSEIETAPTTGSAANAVGTLKGRYFYDANNSDKQDASDSGVANTTVSLVLGNEIIATTTTDSAGNYTFTGLADGSYAVQFEYVAGYDFARTGVGSNDNIDSDVWKINADGSGLSSFVDVSNGTAVSNVDAGLQAVSATTPPPVPIQESANGALTGSYFFDTDGSNTESASDNNVVGAEVRLMQSGEVVATTRTEADGSYSFDGLRDGWYGVEFGLVSSAYQFARGNTGSNDQIDSDVWTIADGDGVTASFEIRGGNTVSNVDAGLQVTAGLTPQPITSEPETGSVAGRLFEDANGDGVNNYETGGPITDVLLVNEAAEMVRVTQTDASGRYSFDDVVAGSYEVRLSGLEDGKTLIEANVGNNDAIDSDAIGQWGGGAVFTATFDVAAGEDVSNIDFGYTDEEAPATPVVPTPTPTPLAETTNGLPDAFSIIHVGNSYQFFGEVENWPSVQFSTLMEVAGIEVSVRRIGISSSSLDRLWNTSEAADLIEARDFDLLILNGMVTVTSESGGASFARYADIFTDHADANGTETIFYGPWAFDNWISISGGDRFGPVAHEKYTAAALDNGAGYSPTGMAMAEAHRQLTEIYGNGDDGQTAEDMLTSDYVHATPLGGYLAANVLFESTFGQSAPSASEWRPEGISLRDANLMQDIARDVAAEYAIAPDLDFVA